MQRVGWLVLLLVYCLGAMAQQGKHLYKATLLQAAPGKLLELIDLEKIAVETTKTVGDSSPLWMRHSQGDRWDLLILFPMDTYSNYYQPERVSRRERAQSASPKTLQHDIAWQEDVFVYGPAPEEVRKAFADAGLFHVEMFQALPDKHDELYKERQMENAYARALHEPENLIFVRDQGAAWDLFTIGCFRNFKHYAEGTDLPEKESDAAAAAAGFSSARQVGPYLRTLIALHHDTLAVAVK
jgi:hypothetical protein